MTELEKLEMQITLTYSQIGNAIIKNNWQRVNDLSKYFRKLMKNRDYYILKKKEQNG